METFLFVFVTAFLAYLLIGVLFALYFFFKGALRLDPLIADGKWTVRLLLMPGVIALWPLLLLKLLKKKTHDR